MERISRDQHIPTAMLITLKEVAEQARAAGVEVIQPLLDAGAIDISISAFTAYQMLGKPDAASNLGIAYLLQMLDNLDLSSSQAKPVVSKLRSAGVDSFRYLLDHPLVCFAITDTSVQATRIAALVRGTLCSPLFSPVAL